MSEQVMVIYGLCVALQAAIGCLCMFSAYQSERRVGARLVVSAILWPMVWVWAAWHGLKHVISEADLRLTRSDA